MFIEIQCQHNIGTDFTPVVQLFKTTINIESIQSIDENSDSTCKIITKTDSYISHEPYETVQMKIELTGSLIAR